MNTLLVKVNDELTLNAGTWEVVTAKDGKPERRVYQPTITLFDQLVSYLAKYPNEEPSHFLRSVDEAAAAYAVCLRWGTYFAVLADRTKPPCDEIGIEDASRIGDSEMARINIEASSALEQWIEIRRADLSRYRALVYAAKSRLPLTRYTPDPKTKQSEGEQFLAMCLLEPAIPPSFKAKMGVVENNFVDDERILALRRNAVEHPTRILANALVNACWRNGPVEDIHAGVRYTLPLTRCRITLAEERKLTRTTLNRMKEALRVIDCLVYEEERTWPERVLPYGNALFIAPHGWSLDESSREIYLPDDELS